MFHFFCLLSISLSRSSYLDHEFDRLTRVDSEFLSFLLIFFFNFILITCFDFLSIQLSWSHDPGLEFDKLTRVDSIYFHLNIFF